MARQCAAQRIWILEQAPQKLSHVRCDGRPEQLPAITNPGQHGVQVIHLALSRRGRGGGVEMPWAAIPISRICHPWLVPERRMERRQRVEVAAVIRPADRRVLRRLWN